MQKRLGAIWRLGCRTWWAVITLASTGSPRSLRWRLPREVGKANKVLVDRACALAAFADRPDDERLPAAYVACRKDLGHGGRVSAGAVSRGLRVAARVALYAEFFQKRLERRNESHGEEHELGGYLERRTRNLARLCVLPLQAHGLERAHLAVLAQERLRRNRPVAARALFVRRRGAKPRRPIRPHRVALDVGRHGEKLELRHRFRAVAVRCPHAVGASIPAADDDHVLAARPEIGDAAVARDALVLQRQKLHCEMDAVELAARDRQVARLLGAAGEHHGVELGEQLLRRDVAVGVVDDAFAGTLGTDECARPELHALRAHLLQAPVDDGLLQLEVRDAVAQQAADAVGLLEHCDVVAGARQLLRARQPGAAGPDDRHLLAGLVRGGLRLDPAFFPGFVDDRVLDRLDAHGIVVDPQHARFLARRGTDPAGELGEVVRRMQHIDRRFPVLPVNEIVPVGDDVVDRAAGHAEGDAAVHAARTLHARGVVGEPQVELAIVLLARLDRLMRLLEPLVLEKSGDLAHYAAFFFVPASSPSARRYSFGNTLTKRGR